MKIDQNQKEEVTFRNHFSSVFEKIWSLILVLAAIIVANISSVADGMDMIANGDAFGQLLAGFGGLILLVIVIVAWNILRWWKTTLTIKGDILVYERRTLNRLSNNISMSKISNINLEQNLFEMIMGTYTLKIDTSSLTTADNTDLEFVLKKEQAYWVKNYIVEMTHREDKLDSGSQEIQNPTMESMEASQEEKKAVRNRNGYMMDEEDMPFDVEYSVGDVIKNGLVTIKMFQLIVGFGALISVIASLEDVFFAAADINAALGAMVVFVIVIIGAIISLIKRMQQDYHFRARREADKIFVSCGLFKKRNYAVPVNKINAIVLDYTFIGRLCGQAYVKVINVGGENDDVDGMKFLLAGSYRELEEKIKLLLPEFTVSPKSAFQKTSKKVLLHHMLLITFWGGLIGSAIIEGAFALLGYAADLWIPANERIIVLAVYGVIVLFQLLMGFSRYHASAVLLDEKYCAISRGTFGKQIVFIPYDRIQYIHMDQSPFMQLFGLQSGNIKILASVFSQTQNIGTFERSVFAKLADKLKTTY